VTVSTKPLASKGYDIPLPMLEMAGEQQYMHYSAKKNRTGLRNETKHKLGTIIIIIIIFHHKFRLRWPALVSAFMSYSSLFSGLPGRCVPFG
jgi:hypothetical protein